MRKLSAGKKKTLSEPHPAACGVLSGDIDSVQDVPTDSDTAFLMLMAATANLQRKDFQYGMHVSKELVKMWFEGTRHNPLRRARDMVDVFRNARAVHLIPTILEYIAGSDFKGRILSAEEAAALMKLAKRSKEP